MRTHLVLESVAALLVVLGLMKFSFDRIEKKASRRSDE
jgi:hypothetical protein